MAILTIPEQNRSIKDPEEIREWLAARNVFFDQWETPMEFAPDADQATILKAYEHVLSPYMQSNQYAHADVINVTPETPGLDGFKQKFLAEHTHSEDEVRFFVEGEGFFWFNLEGGEPVFCVQCQAGDLISVPAGTRHWFDMGPKTFVKAIRMFIDTTGWVPEYTGSGLEQKYLKN